MKKEIVTIDLYVNGIDPSLLSMTRMVDRRFLAVINGNSTWEEHEAYRLYSLLLMRAPKSDIYRIKEIIVEVLWHDLPICRFTFTSSEENMIRAEYEIIYDDLLNKPANSVVVFPKYPLHPSVVRLVD